MQDTALAALQAPPRHDGGVRAWLRVIAANLVRNRRRGALRLAQRERATARAAQVPAVDEIVVREEARRRVVDAVLALPAPLRDVVLLRYFEGVDSRRISERLRRPASTVRTQLQSALDQLRSRLDREHGGRRAAWVLPLLRACPDGLGARSCLLTVGWTGRIAAVVLLALGGLWLLWSEPGQPLRDPGQEAPVVVPAEQARADEPLVVRAPVAESTAKPEAAAGADLQAPRGSLSGRVLDEDTRLPVAGATVELRARAPATDMAPSSAASTTSARKRTATTTAGGAFAFPDLGAGAYELAARDENGRARFTTCAVGSTQEVVDLLLRPPHAWRGLLVVHVVDVAGADVPDAAVQVVATCTRRGAVGWNGTLPIEGRTDREGVFQFHDPERLELVFEGMATARSRDGRVGRTVIARPEHRGYSPRVRIVVDRPGEVRGELSGLLGRRWSGTKVRVHPTWVYGALRPGLRTGVATVPVSAAGTFHVEGLEAGRYAFELLDAPGVRCVYADFERQQYGQFLPVVLVPAGQPTSVSIAVAAAARLRGRVVDENGQPIEGAEVVAAACVLPEVDPRAAAFLGARARKPDPDLVIWRQPVLDVEDDAASFHLASATRTDGRGEYQLTQLQPLAHDVWVSAPGCARDLRLGVVLSEGGETTLEHRLVRGGSIHGVAVEDVMVGTRRAIAGAPLLVVQPSAGAFTVAGLEPGEHEVGYWQSERRWIPVRRVRAVAGESIWVDLRREAAVSVQGTVLVQGEPAAGIEVACRRAVARTAADGSFRLSLDEAGVAGIGGRLTFRHRGLFLSSRDLTEEVLPDGIHLGSIPLEARCIDLRAIGVDGRPAAALLRLEGRGILQSHEPPVAVPAADGELREQWFPLGAHEVSAQFADDAVARAAVTVTPDEPAGPIVLRAQPGGRLALRVIDARGRPVGGVTVDVFAWGRNTPAPDSGARLCAGRDPEAGQWFVHTDRDGAAMVRVPAGPVLAFVAQLEGGMERFGYDDPPAAAARAPSPGVWTGNLGLPPAEAVVDVQPSAVSRATLVLRQ